MSSSKYHQLHPPRFLLGSTMGSSLDHGSLSGRRIAGVLTRGSRPRASQRILRPLPGVQVRAQSPAEADPADRPRAGGLGPLDHRDADGLFEIGTVAGHAGAAHDHHFGAVIAAPPGAAIDHAA